MKFNENVYDEIERHKNRIKKFDQLFMGFLTSLEYLKSAQSPIPDIVIEYVAGETHVDVKALGVHLRFHYVNSIKDGSLLPFIACFRLMPEITKKSQYLGRTIFNGQGVCDFEVAEGKDPVTIDNNGDAVCLYFLKQAMDDDNAVALITG
jgi:hypothetical protein